MTGGERIRDNERVDAAPEERQRSLQPTGLSINTPQSASNPFRDLRAATPRNMRGPAGEFTLEHEVNAEELAHGLTGRLFDSYPYDPMMGYRFDELVDSLITMEPGDYYDVDLPAPAIESLAGIYSEMSAGDKATIIEAVTDYASVESRKAFFLEVRAQRIGIDPGQGL